MKKIISTFLSLFIVFSLIAQKTTITGKVIASDGNAPMQGVNVTVKGTTIGTVTIGDGTYSIQASSRDIIVFSFVGYETVEVIAGSQKNIDATLSESTNSLSEVFVTASTQAVRRIETVTAVNSIGAKELSKINPVNLPDAIRYTPGVYIQTQAGRVRNFIFMRGFPDVVGNGLGYTSLLSDGLRTFASPEMVPDAAFRYDLNIEKIEVVRGSAATMYGRGAAAGAVNVITKTGGTEFGGIARYTFGQYGMNQVDLNLNGPLNESKTLRGNIGGFVLRDNGFRNNLYPDQGGQFRGNIDYLMPSGKGSLRVSGGMVNLNIQNQIDIPYKSNDFSQPAPGFTSRDITVRPADFAGKSYTFTYPDGVTKETVNFDEVIARGNSSKGWNLGANFDFNFGNGWSIKDKTRYQDMTVAIGFDFGSSTTWGPNATGAVTANRLMFGGGNTGGGSHAKDFINELRLNKVLGEKVKHNFTIGHYFSTINVKVASVGAFYSYNLATAADRKLGALLTAAVYPVFRNGDYTESVNSIFAGDDIDINNKLKINVGIRQDWIKMDLNEDRFAYQRNVNRKVDHSGLSASIGFNYLMKEKTSIYGNLVRAYRAPDYGIYTTVIYGFKNANGTISNLNSSAATTGAIQKDEQGRILYSADKPYVDENEIINSTEIGIRSNLGDLTIDGGVFYNTIQNRLISTFIGAIATSVPGGNNKIIGSELSLTYQPKAAKGFFVRTNMTIQNAEYTKLNQTINATRVVDLKGNKTANVPPMIWNFGIGYDGKKFGANLNNNMIAARFADPHNTIKYPTYSLVDANVYYSFVMKDTHVLRVKLSGNNMLNNQSAGNIISAVTDNYLLLAKENPATNGGAFGGTTSFVRGVPLLPRRMFLTIDYTF